MRKVYHFTKFGCKFTKKISYAQEFSAFYEHFLRFCGNPTKTCCKSHSDLKKLVFRHFYMYLCIRFREKTPTPYNIYI